MLKYKWLNWVCILLFSWILIHTIFVVSTGLSNKACKSDMAVVLGTTVNEDGTLSKRLEMRLKCALSLYQSHCVNYILVSGGYGKEGYFEGDVMKYFLLQNHMPDSAIIVDNKGDNTLKTVNNTIALAHSKGINSITVVSQYYHIARCKMLFHKMGFENICGAAPVYFEMRDLYAVPREFFAYYATLVNTR